jgi:hypothetical protein
MRNKGLTLPRPGQNHMKMVFAASNIYRQPTLAPASLFARPN